MPDNTIQVRENDTQNLSSNIMNGDKQALMLHASLASGVSINLHLQVMDADYVEAHAEEITQVVDGFIARTRALGKALNLPL